MVNDTRPVWLTREQRDGIKQARIVPWLVDAWDAAPADPAEAVLNAWPWGRDEPHIEAIAADVLAALGAPKATP